MRCEYVLSSDVTHLVWLPRSEKPTREGLVLGGLVHEEVHPCFSYLVQIKYTLNAFMLEA